MYFFILKPTAFFICKIMRYYLFLNFSMPLLPIIVSRCTLSVYLYLFVKCYSVSQFLFIFYLKIYRELILSNFTFNYCHIVQQLYFSCKMYLCNLHHCYSREDFIWHLYFNKLNSISNYNSSLFFFSLILSLWYWIFSY